MAVNAHIDDAAVDGDFNVIATITYSDPTNQYSKQVTLSLDPNLTLTQIQTRIIAEGQKHKALSAKKTAYNAISTNGSTKPYLAYIGADVAVP